MIEVYQDLPSVADVGTYFAEGTDALPGELFHLTTAIRDAALAGVDTFFEVEQQGRDPEMTVFDALADIHEESSCRRELDPDALRELNVLQLGVRYFNGERQFVVAQVAAIERAHSYMARRGRLAIERLGLIALDASAKRATKASSAIIWPVKNSIDRALSILPVHGVPIDVFTPYGDVRRGSVESWGRLPGAGLGIAVKLKSGKITVVGAGNRNYALRP